MNEPLLPPEPIDRARFPDERAKYPDDTDAWDLDLFQNTRKFFCGIRRKVNPPTLSVRHGFNSAYALRLGTVQT